MLPIVIAIIRNKKRQILITKRASEKHQGGKWEFPGGKVEQGESQQQALKRELNEELGIQIINPIAWMQIEHNYGELAIFLDVYQVSQWLGKAYGKEGQPIRWVNQEALVFYSFPKANQEILKKLTTSDP